MTSVPRGRDIYDIADQFDRLFPHLVDGTEIDWGHGRMAGHKGYDRGDKGEDLIGWYCDGGNAGNPVMAINREDIQRAWEILSAMDPGEAEDGMKEIESAFAAANVRFERLV